MAGNAGTDTLTAPPPVVESAYTPGGAVAAPPATAGAAAGDRHARPVMQIAPVQSHPLRTLLIVLGVILTVTAIVLVSWHAHVNAVAAQSALRAQTANRPVPVVTAFAHRGDMPIFIEGLGTVTPFNVVTIHTRVNGQIMKLYFKEGQIVKEGDPLVQIDPRPYQVQLAQAQAQLAKDQAALQNARSNVAMDQSAQNAISQQQLANDIATADQDIAATQIDQAQIDSAKLQLTYCNITSPIAGRVGLQLVNLGNIVNTGDSTGICVITQLQPIAVEFSVNEDDIPRIMDGSATVPPLEVDAFDRDNLHRLAAGKLIAIDSQIDPTTGTVKLKATFDNKDNALFPSQFVNAHLLVKTERNAVLVPTQAVQQGPDSTFVYVVNERSNRAADSTAAPADVARLPKPESQDQPAQAEQSETSRSAASEHSSGPVSGPAGGTGKAGGWGHGGDQATVSVRTVTLGASDGLQTVIASGLQSGEIVVTDGVDKLQNQSKVTPRAGAAEKPADDNAAAATQPSTQPAGQRAGRHRRQPQSTGAGPAGATP